MFLIYPFLLVTIPESFLKSFNKQFQAEKSPKNPHKQWNSILSILREFCSQAFPLFEIVRFYWKTLFLIHVHTSRKTSCSLIALWVHPMVKIVVFRHADSIMSIRLVTHMGSTYKVEQKSSKKFIRWLEILLFFRFLTIFYFAQQNGMCASDESLNPCRTIEELDEESDS